MSLLQDIAFYASLKEGTDYTDVDKPAVVATIRKSIQTMIEQKYPGITGGEHVLDAMVEVYQQGYKDGRNQSPSVAPTPPAPPAASPDDMSMEPTEPTA